MWVFSSKRVQGGSDFYIGAAKVCKIRFRDKDENGKWAVSVAFWDEVPTICASMSEGLKFLHQKLKESPTEEELNT